MLRDAAPCNEVMARFADFIADHNLVAHNAAFDQRFLDAEFGQIRHRYRGQFGCSCWWQDVYIKRHRIIN